jgi:hypothetical protein
VRIVLRLLRRILIAVVIALAVVFVSVNWIAPVALSFYAARKAPTVARVVPIDLKEKSVSEVPGTKLSYFGYEFEVPWSDLDEKQTKLYPKDGPTKNRVDLHFSSGLRLVVTALPPREFVNGLPENFKVSSQAIESAFGRDTMRSDYSFVKAVYEFTPDRMNHWVFSHGGVNRDEFLLIIKSIVPVKAAESGIFNVQNQSYKGFQQGNPQVRQDGIFIDLYSDEGGVETIFLQKDYKNSAGVTQPEINRIVQSLRKAPQHESTTPRITQK